jgi:hypothetical protein
MEKSADKYVEAIKDLTPTARESKVQREPCTAATGAEEPGNLK